MGVTAPIKDYAVVGDGRSAALVSRHGSIDWLCWPRFDSPSLFGALLDRRAGRWSLRPIGPYRVGRAYVEGTNVLQTVFETAGGELRVTDLMPVASEEEKRTLLLPDHHLLRQLECTRGEVEVEQVFDPRPEFALGQVRWRRAGRLGLRAETGRGVLVLNADLPLGEPGAEGLRSRFALRAGEVRHLSLTFDHDWPAVLPPVGPAMREAVVRSVRWWRRWSAQLTYDGPCRDVVLRSALVLKLLGHAPSGAIIAAPTTSLPERIGGELNWDYRFCWLRDASLTVRALYGLGFREEADAFLEWLLHATRLTQPRLQVLYDVYGKAPRRERLLEHLEGHQGSRPVRVGNAAAEQLQLDVHGEVIDAAAQAVHQGRRLDRETQRLLRRFGDYVCRHWDTADEGIWEPRSGRRHHTHSRLLCWTALDRLVALAEQGHLRGADLDTLKDHRARIRRQLEQRAWHPRLGSYVATLDGEDLDATLLLIPWYGFEDAASPRMKATYRRVRERLGARHGLLYRYHDGESAGEGAFGITSFWGAEYLALGGGTVEEAEAALEELASLANDVGLFAEELDPQTGDFLGNFPQAFTHVGLINAAMSLSRRLQGRTPREPRDGVASGASPFEEAPA